MAKLSITIGSETREFHALSQTLLGTGPASSWPLKPPMFSTTPGLLPSVWGELRWHGKRQGWKWRSVEAMRTGGSEAAWRELQAGSVVREFGVAVTLVDDAPPVPLAVSVDTTEVVDGTELNSIAEEIGGEWFDLEGRGPLSTGDVIAAVGRLWVFHPGKPPKPTNGRGVDCGSPATEVHLDLTRRKPLLRVRSGKRFAAARSTHVDRVATYVIARKLGGTDGGWLTKGEFVEAYARRTGQDLKQVRANLSNESRCRVQGQLKTDGARRVSMLFEVGRPPSKAVRLRCDPERIHIIGLDDP